MKHTNGIPVVVTTEHRGVFFGYAAPGTDLLNSTKIRLERCRMCIYWPQEQHGITGLSSSGPVAGAKVAPPAIAMNLNSITSIMECSDDAVKAWEGEPWN